ncbi:hypothetical protein UUU_36500 (plasmid) [Klebsiella pneumoniae subsp. pneumoniae DSM 30104 = JCM 1662 = NBRC 14940]|nr:hypothetical protein UUU_36500 [Klebsiella pneumoniae subsp. pneumoniae DSM 30104 = JCM 1662 = NBRC 14940]
MRKRLSENNQDSNDESKWLKMMPSSHSQPSTRSFSMTGKKRSSSSRNATLKWPGRAVCSKV